MKNLINKFLGAIAISVLFSACGEADLASPAVEGRVRFFHAVADAPGVQVSVDGKILDLTKVLNSRVVNDSLVFRGSFPADSTYIGVSAGEKTFSFAPIGGTTVLLEAKANIASGKSYSIFAVDSLAKINPFVIADEFLAPKTRVAFARAIHLSPNAPAVNVVARYYRTTPGTNTRVFSDTIVLNTNTSYKAFSTWNELKSDSCDIDIRPVGSNTSVATLARVGLLQGRHYSIVARGFVGRTGTQALGLTSILHSR